MKDIWGALQSILGQINPFREQTYYYYKNDPKVYTSPKQTPVPKTQAVESYSQSPFRPNIQVQTDQGTQRVPDSIASAIFQAFEPTKQATTAASVLSHPYKEQTTGYYGRGENQGFVTGRGWNDYNHVNPNDPNSPIVYITNPFTGKQEPSEDRGLFRINNSTFYDLLQYHPQEMAQIGLKNHSDYNKLYDPDVNARVASLIQQLYGWNRWAAAPMGL